ncbi:MAG TPA: cation:proton antiporter [Terriglobales bacterium]|nr:cation:proton antiporter [Terriglobales bacterium]
MGDAMNELASVALILLLSLLAGHLVKFLRIPEVTGYILAGIIVGPSVLGWINEQNLTSLSVFSEIALALILFSIGSIFEFGHFRSIGRSVVRITALECFSTAILVTLATLAAGEPWRIAVLLGVVAMETGAASTLMVIREYNAQGPFTQALTGVIAINNLFCLGSFLLVTAVLQLTGSFGSSGINVYQILYTILWQLLGSIALGYLVGLLLAAWCTKVVEHGETLILLIGCVLLCAGVSLVLDLSTLVVSLTLGATTANFSANTGRLARVQSRTDPPFYAVFFVIAGAHLQLGLLKSLGVVGLAYILGRAIGKIGGGYAGARLAQLPDEFRGRMGFGLMAHAGLAIGLVLSLTKRFPNLGAELSTIVLGAILVYEIAGPVSVRNVLLRSGESQARTANALEVLE